MRTVDPEIWTTKIKDPRTARRLFGTQKRKVFENGLRNSFKEAMKGFWMNCSIEVVKYMRERNVPRNVRRCYIASILVLTLFGLLTLWRTWAAFRSVPLLIVTLVSSQYPVRHVDFPAVALCSNNLISRTALNKYASYLYSLDVNGTYALDDIQRNLLTFGALVTWSGPPVDGSFLEYLARVAHETNVTNVIMKLTPQCPSFLTRCGWRTARVPCERLFALRPTPHGFCCVFNSRYQDEDLNNPVQRLHFAGQDAGLSLVVQKDDSDIAFVRGPEDGVEVLLFDGSEYPLIEGGSSKVYLTHRGTSAFLKLKAKAQRTDPYLHYYSEEWRGCRIRHVRSRNIDHRSQTWCLANCRRQSVKALCGCVPHLMFPQPGDTVCSPDQLACLNKHKEKLTNFYPGEFADPSLSEESSDSIYCDHCRPDCARLMYSAASIHADYQFTNKLFLNFFVNGVSLINTTILRIYYASEDQKLYIVEANRRWFETVGFLSSQWLCAVSLTLVGAAELVYYATVRWGYHYIRRWRLDGSDEGQLKRPATR